MSTDVAGAEMLALDPIDLAPTAATADAAALAAPEGRDRSPQSLALLLAKAAERVRTDPAENFAHCAVRGAADVLCARLDDRMGESPEAARDSRDEP